jgi:hypothetical protein
VLPPPSIRGPAFPVTAIAPINPITPILPVFSRRGDHSGPIFKPNDPDDRINRNTLGDSYIVTFLFPLITFFTCGCLLR